MSSPSMRSGSDDDRMPLRRLLDALAVQALTWLVAANAVGLLLATLLAWPAIGAPLAPLTYGRWAPVHLDLQLYGWASLPLVALLLRAFFRASPPGRLARLAVHAWGATLVVGAASWLSGGSSGKLFLEWSGLPRMLLAGTLGILAVALAAGFVRGFAADGRVERLGKAALLLALLPVPALLFWSASPRVYPAINPDSGGATGGNLLGSTLGIVLVLMLVPLLAGLRPRRTRLAWATFGLLAAHVAGFAALDHGNRSHHEPAQLVALASLAAWLPLLVVYLRLFDWPAGSPRWLRALAAWGAVLLATGLAAFLPGMLERFKFTHALVAHAHVALAGFVTALDAIALVLVLEGGSLAHVLDDAVAFRAWNAGLAVHVTSLIGLGLLEQSQPGVLFHDSRPVSMLLVLRWASGLVMLVASARWLARAAGAHACRNERTDTLDLVSAERAA